MKVLLDTNVLIEVMKKRLGLGVVDDYFINPIVYGELGYGFVNMGKDLEELDKYLNTRNITCLEIGLTTAKIYANVKVALKNNPIADNDLLVASSAMEYGMKLWTLNKKHFERIKGLGLL